ncbi:MAG: hypothetical protein II653_04375 [Lachnospiraceae bacterium]|nr:hypothetical protein [Lachnospiraceae bacterium]
MSIFTNAKTLINTLFLSGTEVTVTKTFGDYESAAQAQADVNLLAAYMDAGVVRKNFSKRKKQNVLFIEDTLEPEEKKPEDMKEAFIAWFSSLDEENKKFIRDALK